MKTKLFLLSGLAVLLVALLLLSLQGNAQAYNPIRPTPSVPATLTVTNWLPFHAFDYTASTTVRPTPAPATPVRPTLTP
jgi:hypothetical protein